uniref:Putative retroelement pol polyprotein n=1 Tax=Albugo laibachii Nc14 TaxID=890382 RepID=F0X1C7_9STRA|nr:putative retroelement pol polyprotein [Albugo laibachii Nc14]|eukprot:CCA27604.1 putative retroelement pol polyprotein [Albugo laibachii Nc14]
MEMTLGNNVLFRVETYGSDFVAKLRANKRTDVTKRFSNMLMSVATEDVQIDVQEGTLHHFHARLGHLAYDSIEKLAKDPRSGIKITDHTRPNCLTCAEGKPTKAKQAQKDTGQHAPIDRVGGTIVQTTSGYLPLERKMQQQKYLGIFSFDRNVDLFCKETGVRRQVTEAGSPASNGKTERMNRTIFNMIRCMIFCSGVPLMHWSKAAEYATYILNRSPTRSNPGRVSPIESLTKKQTSVSDIVVFGSPCMAWRDPKKKSLERHAEKALIPGKNDETKGYKVLLLKDRVVTSTRHVSNIETLNDEANKNIVQALVDAEEDELKHLAWERATREQSNKFSKEKCVKKEHNTCKENDEISERVVPRKSCR